MIPQSVHTEEPEGPSDSMEVEPQLGQRFLGVTGLVLLGVGWEESVGAVSFQKSSEFQFDIL